MLCDICGKKAATVHLTEIVDDEMSELHLCEECARQKSAQMEQHFGLSDLLAGLADFGSALEATATERKKCPNCGLTYADFKRIGRFGCSECYSVFKELLAPLLKRIHGSTQHLGKVPLRTARVSRAKSELEDLKARLQKAIQLEEFEEAAKLRDKIRELERKNK
jgi:protein arginine kinase activator